MPTALHVTKHSFVTHTWQNQNFQNVASDYDLWVGQHSPSAIFSLLPPITGSQAAMYRKTSQPPMPPAFAQYGGIPQVPGTPSDNIQCVDHPLLEDLIYPVVPLSIVSIEVLWDVQVTCVYRVENTSANSGTIAFAAHKVNLGIFLPAFPAGNCPINGQMPASGTLTLAATDGTTDFIGLSGATVAKTLSFLADPMVQENPNNPGPRTGSWAEGGAHQPPVGLMQQWGRSGSGPGSGLFVRHLPAFTVAAPAVTYGGSLVAGNVTIANLYRAIGTYSVIMKYNY